MQKKITRFHLPFNLALNKFIVVIQASRQYLTVPMEHGKGMGTIAEWVKALQRREKKTNKQEKPGSQPGPGNHQKVFTKNILTKRVDFVAKKFEAEI